MNRNIANFINTVHKISIIIVMTWQFTERFSYFMIFIDTFQHSSYYNSVFVRTILSLLRLPQGLYKDLCPDSQTFSTVGYYIHIV